MFECLLVWPWLAYWYALGLVQDALDASLGVGQEIAEVLSMYKPAGTPCPRCMGGSILNLAGEASCLACGFFPGGALPAWLVREEAQMQGRRRQPQHGKVRL